MDAKLRRQMIEQTHQRFTQRFGEYPPSSGFAFIKASIATHEVLDAVSKVRENEELNDVGLQRALQKAINGDPVNGFKAAHGHYQAKLQEFREARAKLANPKIDRSDLGALLLRQEIRAMVRSMPAAERIRFIFDQEDPVFLAAMLEVPAGMTGLHAAQIAQLQSAWIERESPEVLKAMKAEEEALEFSAIALQGLAQELQSALAIKNPVEWKAWLKETIGQDSVAEHPGFDPVLDKAA